MLKFFNFFLIFILVAVNVVIWKEVSFGDKKEVLNIEMKNIGIKEKTIDVKSKEIVNYKNELPKAINKEKLYITEKEKNAIIKFEKIFNEKINKTFKKPFNYKENSNCEIEVNIPNGVYKIKKCNSDEIFKRQLSIAINKANISTNRFYDGVDLGKKVFLINTNIK